MAASSKEEVEVLLDRLHDFSPNGTADADKAKDAVVDIAELLSTDLSSIQYELFISLSLGERGLLTFCRQSVRDQAFADAKKSALEVVRTLIDKDAAKLSKYMDEIVAVPLLLYRVDLAAKVRCSALELFCLVLQRGLVPPHTVLFDVSQLVNNLFLGVKGSKVPSVVYHELRTLGMLTYALPEQSRPHANFILKVLRDQLFKHTGSRPELTILAGCLRGLSLYLHHYPEGDQDDPAMYAQLYEKLHKTLNPGLQLPKRDAQRAGLELLHHHGAKFSPSLLEEHQTLFPWLLRWCGSPNRDDSRAGRIATDTFLAVIAAELELNQTKLAQKAFKFLIGQFNSLLESNSGSYSVGLAVRGYGLLAAACKQLLPPHQLGQLFVTVLTTSQHAFYQSSELLDTKLDNLPSYIQSLATIVKHMPTVDCSAVISVVELSVSLVHHYPTLTAGKQWHAHAALMALLSGGDSGHTMEHVRHLWVHQAVLFSCSHLPPVTEEDTPTSESDSASSTNSGTSGVGRGGDGWRGVADQVVTYKSFLPMWKALLSPETASKIKLPGVPVSRLTEVSAELFAEYLSCLTDILDKLDLSTTRQNTSSDHSSDVTSSTTFSNPVTDLVANTPKDFQVYHNLVALTTKILTMCSHHQHSGNDITSGAEEGGVDPLGEGPSSNNDATDVGFASSYGGGDVVLTANVLLLLVSRATAEPLVAPHYTLIGALLRYLQGQGYFQDLQQPPVPTVVEVVCGFARDCSERSKQFSDHLLASCLLFLLHLPQPLARRIAAALLHPLQVALVMGLSYIPVGLAAVCCLQRFTADLSLSRDAFYQAEVRAWLPSVLPKLLPYLTSRETEGAEVQSRVISVKMALLNQRRRVDTRKLKDSAASEQSSALRAIQSRVVRLLGGLDAELCRMVGYATPDEVADIAVRWDKHQHVSFKAPYQLATLDLHLDGLVPRVTHLALHSSDRKTKVAASELLHAILIILIGSGRTAVHSASPVYLRLFSACLQLACDPDHVSRQLFLTLLLQATHYFTNNRGYEHPDTAALLIAIMEGLVSPSHPALRDVSARCLLEFLVWSRKQNTQVTLPTSGGKSSRRKDTTTSSTARSSHPNVKSVIKRILHLLCHPSAYKRIGGCLALNSVYTEVRECPVTVDEWLLELVVAVFTCLVLCDADDPALPTRALANTALGHLQRMLIHYKDLFNEPSEQRRLPGSMTDGDGTLSSLMEWLICRIADSAATVRHAATPLLAALGPYAKGSSDLASFTRSVTAQGRVPWLMLESGGARGTATSLLSHGAVDGTEGKVSQEKLKTFLKHLLASLDGLSWLLGQRLLCSEELFVSKNSVTLTAVRYFITKLAAHTDLSRYLDEVNSEAETTSELEADTLDVKSVWSHHAFMPSEKAALLHAKCSLLIRVFDFVKVMLSDSKDSFGILQKNSILCKDFFCLLIRSVLDPSSLGFNIRDTEVLQHLLPRMTEILTSLRQTLPASAKLRLISVIEEEVGRDDRSLHVLLPDKSSSRVRFVSPSVRHFLQGLAALHSTKWLQDSRKVVIKNLASDMLQWACEVLYGRVDDAKVGGGGITEATMSPSTSPALKQFANVVLKVAVQLDQEGMVLLVEAMTQRARSSLTPGGGLATPSSTSSALLLGWCPGVVRHCGLLADQGQHDTALALLLALAQTQLEDSALRKKHSREFVEGIISIWPSLSTAALTVVKPQPSTPSNSNSASAHTNSELVTLLSLLFLVDSHGVLTAHCNATPITAASSPSACVLTIVGFWLHLVATPHTELSLKLPTLKLLPFFCAMNEAIQRQVVESLEAFRVHHLPLRSDEFPAGSSRDRDLHRTVAEVLTALELTASQSLIAFVAKLFCTEPSHRYESLLQDSVSRVLSSLDTQRRLSLLQTVYTLIEQQCSPAQQPYRGRVFSGLLMPLLQSADAVCLERFFVATLHSIMDDMAKPVPSKADDQLCVLTAKTGAFLMVQLLYAKLSRNQMFSSASAVNAACYPADSSGKELTKELIKRTVRVAKGELRHDKTHQDLRRVCSCAAYTALIAIIVNIQDDLKFYNNFLFSENASKGEALWTSMIDCCKGYEFDVEVNFKPGSKSRFVAVRKAVKISEDDGEELEGGMAVMDSPTVQMFASNYLSDSSLREDLSQYDFSSAVVLAVGGQRTTSTNTQRSTGGLVRLTLDSSDFNEHEVMAALTAAVLHMQESNITPSPGVGSEPPSELSPWMAAVVGKLRDGAAPRNVKLFMLRLITNTAKVFQPYSHLVADAVLGCIADGTAGAGINYFLADLVVMLVGWGQRGVPRNPVHTPVLREVMRRLVAGIPHTRADVFKYNVELFRTLVAVWRQVASVSGAQVAQLLETTAGDAQQREVEAGLHVVACLLVIGLPPCDEALEEEVARLRRALLAALSDKRASVHNAAAEVVGLMLKRMTGGGTANTAGGDGDSDETAQDTTTSPAMTPSCQLFCDGVVSRIMELFQRYSSRALSCLYQLHKHFPGIASRFASKLLVMLPKLYGLQKTRAFECLLAHLSSLPECFTHLLHHRVSDTIAIKEPATQLVLLRLLNAALPNFSSQQTLHFMPSLLLFLNHPAPACRQVLYTSLTFLHQRYKETADEDGASVCSAARDSLLRAVSDHDTELRNTILDYWTDPATSLRPNELLLYVMRELYSPGSESSFLLTACHVLLQVTHVSPSYGRPIFEDPLTQCKFWEMHVSPAWQARHASMVPLFTNTQASSQGDGANGPTLPQLVALTQGGEAGKALGAILATQDHQFTPTQTVPVGSASSTFNIGVSARMEEESTLVEMQDHATRAPSQGSVGLVFSTSSSYSSHKSKYKRTGLGRTRMNPRTVDDETDSKSTANTNYLVRRRFVRQQDREKQSIHFARLEEKRRMLRQRLQKERKQRREAQVTMLRQYRVGELPDIQIAHHAVIDPLQALAQRDVTVAQHVLVMIADGVLSDSQLTLEDRALGKFSEDITKAVCGLIENSVQCNPQLVKAVMQILLKSRLHCDSEVVTQACISSGQESLGVLVLERLLLEAKKFQDKTQPHRKRQKRAPTLETTQQGQASGVEVSKILIHLAELYGSMGMWDAVRGVLHSGLSSSLHKATQDALHAEALNQHSRAYELYLSALTEPDAQDQSAEEQRVWEERICAAACELGQWGELERFVTQRFLTEPTTGAVDLSRVWTQSHPTSAVLSALVNSRLMGLLSGSDSDGGLVRFVSDALQDENKKMVLEDNLGIQLAVLSVHQEKPEVARSFLETATNKLLETLSHHTILSPKPLASSLRNVQLLLELEDYLMLGRKNSPEEKTVAVHGLCRQWMNNLPSIKDETFFAQSVVLYRDLYLHFVKKEVEESEQLKKVCSVTRASSHVAITELALELCNPELASLHIRKLGSMLLDGFLEKDFAVKYQFLRTLSNIVRGQQQGGEARLKFLVEAWCKYMNQVNKLQQDSRDATIEIQYLSLESRICVELCHAIHALGDSYDPNNRHLQVLAAKFPDVSFLEDKCSWYPSLLECSYNDLTNASTMCEKTSDQSSKASTPESCSKAYDSLANFCEESVSVWKDCIDSKKYNETFVVATLKAMANGSSNAHYNFPRLIHLLDDHPQMLSAFQKEVGRVPIWMFLLWLSHIFIYVDKNPGPALQPLIVKVADEYPQAVFYPFSVSKTGYKFTGKVGVAANAMCRRVDDILDRKCHLLQPFVESMSLVQEPFCEIKLLLEKIKGNVPDSQKIQQLQSIHNQLFKASSVLSGLISNLNNSMLKGSGSEHGEQYRIVYETVTNTFVTHFGVDGKKLKAANVNELKKGIEQLLKCWKNSIKDLKGLSPWLSHFQASTYTDHIEIPGQYRGFSKPMMEYHTKISNFDSNPSVIKSLRSPIVITMHGDDEKAYKFLVKTGEDLRTDQRMELMFTLMNNIYSKSAVTRRLSVPPNLTTFTVVPLSVDIGILQWVDSTVTLKSLIEDSLTEEESAPYHKLIEKGFEKAYLDKLLKIPKEPCVRGYVDKVNAIPWDLLRRALSDLASSHESFFHLRTNFSGSHATLCISQWLLGIGDRHLSNFLVEYKTAKMVGIDFGHHFESTTQFLPIPELIPFRMSPQIVNLLKPLGTNGIMRETMVSCLQALVKSKRLLLAAVEAFVREPTQDWLGFVKRQEGTTSDHEVEIYSSERIKLITRKLDGINPCCILEWAIQKNKTWPMDDATKKFLISVVYGEDQKRSHLPKHELSVPEQVDALLDLATDPNVLGRTYSGWSPLT